MSPRPPVRSLSAFSVGITIGWEIVWVLSWPLFDGYLKVASLPWIFMCFFLIVVSP